LITAEHRLGEQELEAGTVWIKGWAIIADQFEEGDFKQSGVGRSVVTMLSRVEVRAM
jgi:hypothetical protein